MKNFQMNFYWLVLVYFIVSCDEVKSSEKSFDTNEIQKHMRGIVSDSLTLKSNDTVDTLFISISNMPTYSTNKEYNEILMAYVYYMAQSLNQTYTDKIIAMRVEHDYNSLVYSNTYDSKNTLGIKDDFSNENYKRIVEFLLSNIGDEESAYYNLSMSELKKLYPKINTSENIYSILSKYPFIRNTKYYNEEESRLLEMELEAFYWVCQYPYGELVFDREKLQTAFDILGISNYDSRDKAYIDSLYQRL